MRRMDSHHSYQKNVDQNINSRRNTLLAPDALMPGIVIEKNSRRRKTIAIKSDNVSEVLMSNIGSISESVANF